MRVCIWLVHAWTTFRFGRGGKYKRTKDSLATYIYIFDLIRKMWKKRFVWWSTILCSVSVNFFVFFFSWTVPHGEQSLVLVLYAARVHSNIYNIHNIHCMQSAVCLALISSCTRTPVPSTWSVLAGTASLLHVACATTHEMYICLYVCIVWHYKNVVVSLVHSTYTVACICVNTCTYGVHEGCICVHVPCHLFI